MAERILIVSASLGAGHDGAARELARRLESQGHITDTVDFLECAPGVGRLIKRVYEFQLAQAPWSYEALYRVFFKMPSLYRPLVWLTTVLSSRRIRRHIADFGATAVVSTYALPSLTLGKERMRGRICIPTATFVTDFSVHPLWVHPGVDFTITVHANAAQAAAAATGRPAVASGPMVPPRFSPSTTPRAEARRRYGIPGDMTVPLVVAGSWGVGELDATLDDLLSSGTYYPVVVCGSNEALREELDAKASTKALIVGWTDDMATLMAAADVLLQNAGGLTCMEAFAVGLPVVTYRPIPGHGIENAIEMERAGVAPYVRDARDLDEVLARAATLGGMATVRCARTIFRSDPAADILALIGIAREERAELAATGTEGATAVGVASGTWTPVPVVRRGRVRRVAAAGAALAVGYAGANVAAAAAVAGGLDVARAPAHASQVYVGVRLGPSALDDPTLPDVLKSNGVTAILSGPSFRARHTQFIELAADGVDIANGGWNSSGGGIGLMFHNANVVKGSHAIINVTGDHATEFVPTHSVNGLDFSTARLEHEKIVRPTATLAPGTAPSRTSAGQILVIDGENATGAQIENEISLIAEVAHANHVTIAPLSHLH